MIVAAFEHVRMSNSKRAKLKDHLLKPRTSAAAKPRLIEWEEAKRWWQKGAKK